MDTLGASPGFVLAHRQMVVGIYGYLYQVRDLHGVKKLVALTVNPGLNLCNDNLTEREFEKQSQNRIRDQRTSTDQSSI